VKHKGKCRTQRKVCYYDWTSITKGYGGKGLGQCMFRFVHLTFGIAERGLNIRFRGNERSEREMDSAKEKGERF
jgi:hypothetical protein